MVEDLEFAHAVVGGIHVFRGADAHAVVHAFLQEAEFETIHEVAVFLVRVQVAGGAVVGGHIDGAVHDGVAFQVAVPFAQVGAVEEHLETTGLLFRRQFAARRRPGFEEHLVDFVHGIAVIGVPGGGKQGAGLAKGRLEVVIIDLLGALGGNLLHRAGGGITDIRVRIVQGTGGQEERLHERQVTEMVERADPQSGILREADRLGQAETFPVGILLIGGDHVDITLQGSGVPVLGRSEEIGNDGGVFHREEGLLRGRIVSEASQDARRLIRADVSENRIEPGRMADHQGLDTGRLFLGCEGMDGRGESLLKRGHLGIGGL